MSLKRKHTALVFSFPSCRVAHPHTRRHTKDPAHTQAHPLKDTGPNKLPNASANNGSRTNAERNQSCISIINKRATQFPAARQRAWGRRRRSDERIRRGNVNRAQLSSWPRIELAWAASVCQWILDGFVGICVSTPGPRTHTRAHEGTRPVTD